MKKKETVPSIEIDLDELMVLNQMLKDGQIDKAKGMIAAWALRVKKRRFAFLWEKDVSFGEKWR